MKQAYEANKMGTFLSSISILKNKNDLGFLKKCCVEYMSAKGYSISKSETTSRIIIRNNLSSKWATIYQNEFDENVLESFALFSSRNLNTPTVSIINYDSDYMVIHVSYQDVHDRIVVGTPTLEDDKDENRVQYNTVAWNSISCNPSRLLEDLHRNYSLSEEALHPLERETGILEKDINITFTELQENILPDDVVLDFTPNNIERFYIRNGPTLLHQNGYDFPIINKQFVATLTNRGGISTGLRITISGPFLANNDITIPEIEIDRAKNPRMKTNWVNNVVIEKRETTRAVTDNDDPCISVLFPDFEIPEGITDECKQIKEISQHSTIVRFTICGPEGTIIPELQLTVEPICNPLGAATIISQSSRLNEVLKSHERLVNLMKEE